MTPPHQITMLKFIKNLSSLSSTHEALQNSNAIDILIELLKSTRQKDAITRNMNRSASDPTRLPPFHREISNQILNTMYNLCRHNKSRQEEAALSDIIPLLKDVVREGGPLKEFALPVLLEMVNSGKVARKMLWDAKGLAFYVSLLGDRNWAVTALDAIFVWYVKISLRQAATHDANVTYRLQEETARVEQYLLSSHTNFTTAIVSAYTSAELSQSTFENMLEPLQKLVRLSPPIAASLAAPEIFQRTEQKLGHKDAVTRLNLLRILRTICDAKDEGCYLIRAFGCYERISRLMEHDGAVLVRQMAEELVRACDEVDLHTIGTSSNGKRSLSRASGIGMNLRRPTSSAGRRDGSGSSSGSTLVSSVMGLTPPTPNSLKGSFTVPIMSGTPTLGGSGRDRISRSQSTTMWDLAEDPTAPSSSSRSKQPPVLARSSTSFAALGPTGTPTSSRQSSRPPSRDAASSLARIESNNSRPSSGSRLPKARAGRLSEAVNRRRQSNVSNVSGENDAPGTGVPVNAPPLPRLQIVRRRRETSGGELSTAGRKGGNPE
jgi:hypothetical protein